MQLPKSNKGGSAPEVEAGLAVVRLDDIVERAHPDWAGTDNFGNADDGARYHFLTTLVEGADRAVVYAEGEPVELEAMTRMATGKKSNFRAHMEGILTAAEFAAWDADQPLPEDAKVGPIQGRFINVKVGHNKNGWPLIEDFISPIKVGK